MYIVIGFLVSFIFCVFWYVAPILWILIHFSMYYIKGGAYDDYELPKYLNELYDAFNQHGDGIMNWILIGVGLAAIVMLFYPIIALAFLWILIINVFREGFSKNED